MSRKWSRLLRAIPHDGLKPKASKSSLGSAAMAVFRWGNRRSKHSFDTSKIKRITISSSLFRTNFGSSCVVTKYVSTNNTAGSRAFQVRTRTRSARMVASGGPLLLRAMARKNHRIKVQTITLLQLRQPTDKHDSRTRSKYQNRWRDLSGSNCPQSLIRST